MQIKEILAVRSSGMGLLKVPVSRSSGANLLEVSRGERETILARMLDVDRSYLVAHGERELTDSEMETFFKMVSRRAVGEPLAYIFGVREFYGREFLVDSRVLIPRPETETMIDILKRFCCESGVVGEKSAMFPATRRSGPSPRAERAAAPAAAVRMPPQILPSSPLLRRSRDLTVLDVGTGSGCIGVTAGLEIPGARVIATDVSKAALMLARENAERLEAQNVVFMESDLLSAFSAGLSCEGPLVICANLPYVDARWEWLDFSALGYEPELALYAEDGGLALIKRLIRQVVSYDLRASEVSLLLEADPSQHKAIIEFAEGAGLRLLGAEGFILRFCLGSSE